MDDQILENFDVTASPTVNNIQTHITNERINAPSVLRGIEGGSLHFITVPASRDQEFIDHSLLNPEYITTHIPSGFIIDFMNNQDNSNNEQHQTSVATITASGTATTTAETSHFITESSVENVNIVQHPSIHHHHQQQQQEQQQHLEFQDDDRKLTAAFFQLVNDKQYPVKITANEAQVIVTNKDVLQQLEANSKQHHQQQQQNNSVLVAQDLLTAATTAIDDTQQQQQTITQTFLHDNQFRIYESVTQMNLPPLTPISRLIRSRKGTNSTSIQNTQTYGISNSSFNKNTNDVLFNDEVEIKQLSQQQQQRPLAKKNLPHKKRITKKLKIIDKVTDLQQQQQQQQQTQQQVQQQKQQQQIKLDSQQLRPVRITDINSGIQTENVQIFEQESSTITMPQFTCQLCGVGSDSQIEFFSHLKEHYEPQPFKKISSPKKQEIIITNEFSDVSTDMRFDETFIEDNIDHHQNEHQKTEEQNEMNIATTNSSQIRDRIDVHRVEIIHSNQNENELHHIHPESMNNQNQSDNNVTDNNLSTSAISPKDDNSQGPEVEFSDTEDMLEGIRGVVDKVQESVDNDSNDCMNLINGRSWYSNNGLNEAVATNSNLEEPQVDNFALFNRSDIEKLIEQQEQINLDNAQTVITEGTDIDNTSVHDIELPSANELEMSMDSVEIPPPPSPSSSSVQNINATEIQQQNQQKRTRKRKQTKTENDEKTTKKGRKPKKKSKTKNSRSKRNTNAGNKNENEDDDEMMNEMIDDDDDDKEFKFKTKKRVKCTKCDKVFNSANALKYHDLSHTGERPHHCEQCGKSFFAQSALKVHMRLHSGDKPYICEFCNRAFRQWGDLKYHTISIHTTMKSFQCEFCGKAFARRYSLVVHRRIHTCEKNYKCEFCSKSFRASSYLQNHRKIHTGEKPYMCKFCGKKFRVCGDLRRHENIHTRDKRKPSKTGNKKDKDETQQKRNSKKNNKTIEKSSQAEKETKVKIEITAPIDNQDIEKFDSKLISNSNQNHSSESNDIINNIDNQKTANSITSSSSTVKSIVTVSTATATLSSLIDSSAGITVFKTEPNFESSSSTEMTLNNIKIESLSSSSAVTIPISNSSTRYQQDQQQQLEQNNIFVSIPKRQIIIKDPTNSSSGNRIIKDLNDDTSLDTNVNKERFLYFW